MAQRQELRVAHQVSVWVAGTDARGNHFQQTARVVDISRLGARLGEIRCLRAAGQILEIKYRRRKARFLVIWIDEHAGEAGIRSMEPSKNFWDVTFPPASAVKYEPARAAAAGIDQRARAAGGWISGPAKQSPLPKVGTSQNQPSTVDGLNRAGEVSLQMPERREREHARHRCVGGAEVRKEALAEPIERIWGRVTQLSLGGCFVVTMYPFAAQTRVALFLGIQDVQVRAKGIVCRANPGMGMGIKFTEIDEQNRRGLEQLNSNLAKGGKFSQLA